MRVILLFALWLALPWVCQANPALQEQLAAETRKREQSIQPLEKALAQGEKMAAQGETLRAWESLNQAFQDTPEALRNSKVGRSAQETLADWEAKLGEMEARQSRWPKARDWALRCLQRQPDNASARAVLEEANAILARGTVAGEETNPALTNRFFDKLQGVRDGLKEAEQLRETGQLDLAETRYEDVLRIDPFNAVATEGIKKIYQERALVAGQSRDLSNLQRRREVREAWNNIYPKKSVSNGGAQVTGPLTASPSFQLEQKLRAIMIPQIDFSGADLETVRRALNTLSRQYDTDAAKTGVNFVVSADVTASQPVNLKLRNTTLG
ncbi:MAG: hypothetical protein EBV83_05775, partial [Verrucomicrobia bacterium]|nr:hypothetical protein [Verrucomicrobiota bacterium]